MSRLEALASRWGEISALLDEALALPSDDARARWLDALDGERAALRDTLRELLASNVGVETGDFLGTLPHASAADEARAGTRVGPYRLIAELGHGGMGAVWLAERADGQLQRRVALKLPRLAWGSATAARLARERDILAALEHPHIARLYDAGVDAQGRPYFAMELVEGEPIDAWCRERKTPLRERLALLLQVCEAVAHAHSRLVIHRDLKPGNILVTTDGRVKLLDFGIAKLLEGDRTEETALTREAGRALTLDYASPEQIAGAPLGTASDVYSLGVVAYELLAGAKPYRLKRGSAAELEEAIAGADAPRASDAVIETALKKALRGDLDAVLAKAMEKDPGARYPTVSALADDLQRHLDGFPVRAQPVGAVRRLAKFARRHRLAVGAGGTAVLSLAAGLGVALWQAREARLQAQRAAAEVLVNLDANRLTQNVFSRIAAKPPFAQGEGRQAMIDAVRGEIALAEPQLKDKPRVLGQLYALTADLLARLQLADDALAFRLKAVAQFERVADDPWAIATQEHSIATTHYLGGRYDAARAAVQSGLARLGDDRSERSRFLKSLLHRTAANIGEATGRLGEAIAAARAAREVLEPDLTTAGSAYADVSVSLVTFEHLAGDDRKPLALVEELRALHGRMPFVSDYARISLEQTHGFVLLHLGRYAEASAALQRALDLHRKSQGGDGGVLHLVTAARSLFKQGEFAPAQALLDEAFKRLGPGTGSTALPELALTAQADLHLERGDLDAAERALDTFAARPNLTRWGAALVAAARARVDSARGRHVEARERFAAALGQAVQLRGEHVRTLQQWRLIEAEIESAAGRPERVPALLVRWAAPSADANDWTRWRAADLRAGAALARGNTAEAMAWFDQPLAALRPGDATPKRRARRDEALARGWYAAALAAGGRAAEAHAQRQRALELAASQHATSPWRPASP